MGLVCISVLSRLKEGCESPALEGNSHVCITQLVENVGPEEKGIGGTDLLQTAKHKAGLIYISVVPQVGWLCVSKSPTGLLNEYRFLGLIPDLLNESPCG